MTIDIVSELMRQDCDMSREGIAARCVVISRTSVAPSLTDDLPTHMQLASGCYELIAVEAAGICELVAKDPLRWRWILEKRRGCSWRQPAPLWRSDDPR